MGTNSTAHRQNKGRGGRDRLNIQEREHNAMSQRDFSLLADAGNDQIQMPIVQVMSARAQAQRARQAHSARKGGR